MSTNQTTPLKKPIGEVFKQIMTEKRITQAELSRRLNIERQGVNTGLSKTSMTLSNIERWAKALEVDINEIYLKMEGKSQEPKGDDAYLMLYIKQLEEQNSKLNDDLTKALDTIRVLSGKWGSVYAAGFGNAYLFFLAFYIQIHIHVITHAGYRLDN